MPRYFFHIDDGKFLPDEEGTELPNLAAVKSEAVRAAGSILADVDGEIWKSRKPWLMHVTDAAGQLLFTLRFAAEMPSGPVTFRPQA